MKFCIAITLVVVTMVAAEPPIAGRAIFQRQTAAPYQPRGWRPNGPSFNPTSNFQRQQQAPPEPVASYGPPPSASYGPPEVTTTEEPTTTDSTIEATTATLDFQGENLKSEFLNGEQKAEKLQNEPGTQGAPVYVVLPQGQNIIYTPALRPLNAALVKPSETVSDVEVVKEPKLAPVQAIPALAKIQAPVLLAKYEQVPQVVQFQQIQTVPYLRYASSLSQSSVHTPYSDSFVQIYQ